MAGTKKYPVSLARCQWRELWGHIQNARPGNNSHEDWIKAANREILPMADVAIGIFRVQYLPQRSPDEVLARKLSHEATCGAKFALIQAGMGRDKNGQGPSFRVRETIREIADGFGEQFAKLVGKNIALEDSKDLDDDAELSGVPCEEEPAPAMALVKE